VAGTCLELQSVTVAVVWRNAEHARRNTVPDKSRFSAIFPALADAGIKVDPVVY
jgi:hypothetical protein